MRHPHALLGLGLLLVGWTPAAEPAPTLSRGDRRADHAHPRPIDLDDEAFTPEVRLSVLPDPASGWNVMAEVEHFRFAPENAGLRHRAGEGHAHLYVDGLKVARVYGPSFHLASLGPGKHVITYSLNGNTHAPYLERGKPIEDSVEVLVPDPACGESSHAHADHAHSTPVAAKHDSKAARPTVRLKVERDPVSGWNVLADVTRFRFAPENASLDPRPGEGHAHLWVDGEKLARVYGPAFHIPVLAPGLHVVKYSLHGNDHAAIGVEAAIDLQVD